MGKKLLDLGKGLLGAVVRTDDKMITLFKSNGLAIQDAATAKVVCERALAKGIGVNVEI